jgi:DNA helicase-2/ATP-dependent DNA helicase PcrA
MNLIFQAITNRHTHENEIDKEQLAAVFSFKPNLIVEAPAGYGKTKTMVSRIAFLIATGQVPYPKKILALTFSINASFKIRKDVTLELPTILASSPKIAHNAVQSVLTTNYHGLSRRIIAKFGYTIDKKLSEINSLKNVGIDIYNDSNYTYNRFKGNLDNWGIPLSTKEIQSLIDFTKNITAANGLSTRPNAIRHLSEYLDSYLEIIKSKFLPLGYVTFDSIILFARKIFKEHPHVRNFYREYFPTIIVDEFQDTNILQWALLQDIVGRNEETRNQLFIFGDRFQKIYDFIGAMDGIIDLAKSKYEMEEIKLKTNHRFKNNETLINFDENIRKLAINPWNSKIEKTAKLEVYQLDDQDNEARQIVNQINSTLAIDPKSTIAVLTRAGRDNTNTNNIVEEFNRQKQNGFSYFYALYSDEDEEYIQFHQECLKSLYARSSSHLSFQSLCRLVKEDMSKKISSEIWASLQTLLSTFFDHISREYKFLSVEEKIILVVETLQNKSLKQYLMYVTSSQVTLSTIHGSKGLEWDYVILPDMERYSFPSFPGLCRACTLGSACELDWLKIKPSSEFVRLFKQELNVYYVGGTRAKKSVVFTHSTKGINSSGQPRPNNPSCFLTLQGFQIK